MFPPSRKMFVDNEWVAASNGATYAVPNPATEEPVGAAPEATVEDMRRAIAAARRAFDEGPWPRSSRQERARVITAIADGMERRKEELRQMLIAEAGARWYVSSRSSKHSALAPAAGAKWSSGLLRENQ